MLVCRFTCTRRGLLGSESSVASASNGTRFSCIASSAFAEVGEACKALKEMNTNYYCFIANISYVVLPSAQHLIMRIKITVSF